MHEAHVIAEMQAGEGDRLAVADEADAQCGTMRVVVAVAVFCITFSIRSSGNSGSGCKTTGTCFHAIFVSGTRFAFFSDSTIAAWMRPASSGRIGGVPSLYLPAPMLPPQPVK
jgi:hypothetical protein